MSYNAVTAAVVVVHASSASIALLLGAWQLKHRPKGDRVHRLVGRVWVVAMYGVVGTAFFVAPVHITRPNIFQLLAVFTFGTLTMGTVAAVRGNIPAHRGYLTGTYFGLLGAFVGAVAVPQRDIPQLAVHRPVVFVTTVVLLLAAAALIVTVCSWAAHRSSGSAMAPSEPEVVQLSS